MTRQRNDRAGRGRSEKGTAESRWGEMEVEVDLALCLRIENSSFADFNFLLPFCFSCFHSSLLAGWDRPIVSSKCKFKKAR